MEKIKLNTKYLVMVLEGFSYFIFPICAWYIFGLADIGAFSFWLCIFLSFIVGIIAFWVWPSFARFKAISVTLEFIMIMTFYIVAIGKMFGTEETGIIYMEMFSVVAVLNGTLIGFLIRKLKGNKMRLFNPKSKVEYFPLPVKVLFYLVFPFLVWMFSGSGYANPLLLGNYFYLAFVFGLAISLLWPSFEKLKPMLIAFEFIFIISFLLGFGCTNELCPFVLESYSRTFFAFAALFNGVFFGVLIRKVPAKIKTLKS